MSQPKTKRQEPERQEPKRIESQQQQAEAMEVAGATPEIISRALDTAPDDIAAEHHRVARVAYIAAETELNPDEVWERLDEFSGSGPDDRENRDPPADHLSASRPGSGWGNGQSAAKTGEWWCRDCQARITVSQVDKETEYGHKRSCQHCITDDLRWEPEQ